jgi:hypothetical protein
VTARLHQVDPDVGIPDLVRSLTDDSKQLVRDEIRLAKLETRESIGAASKGAMWLGLAFGIGVVALVAFTITLAAVVGEMTGNYWAGALLVGALELVVGAMMLKNGMEKLTEPSYTLEETRQELKETMHALGEARR